MRRSDCEVRNRITYVIDHRNHISPGQLLILFPIRQRLMQIEDRFIPTQT